MQVSSGAVRPIGSEKENHSTHYKSDSAPATLIFWSVFPWEKGRRAVVTKAEVVMAYRLILGRDPENDDVVAEHALPQRSLADLRSDFLAGGEFWATIGRTAGQQPALGFKPLTWRPIEVEVEVEAHILQKMIERIEKEFQYLGETEPHWSVISQEEFKAANIKDKEDEFFRSGKGVIDDFFFASERCGIDLGRLHTCFELGCGVGRGTIWLAERFSEVIGADISAAHLQLAGDVLGRFAKTNVRLLHLNTIDALNRLESFDAFFSVIVLQHNPPPLIAAVLEILLKKLSPGGIGYFQVPTYLVNYRFWPDTYLSTEQPPGVPEMHLIPQSALFRLIERAGCRVLEIREDGAAGAAAISNRLLVEKE